MSFIWVTNVTLDQMRRKESVCLLPVLFVRLGSLRHLSDKVFERRVVRLLHGQCGVRVLDRCLIESAPVGIVLWWFHFCVPW